VADVRHSSCEPLEVKEGGEPGQCRLRGRGLAEAWVAHSLTQSLWVLDPWHPMATKAPQVGDQASGDRAYSGSPS
jgi:hypothetical protein